MIILFHGMSRRGSKKFDVAHNWAHGVESKFKKDTEPGSLFYEGKTIYSYGYHFPIATISKDDPNTAFFTTRGYSNTTSAHISAVRGAVSHLNLVFCNDPKEASQGIHSRNLKDFESISKNEAMKLPSSKKPQIYLDAIAHQRDRLEKYVKACKIKKSELKGLHYVYILTKEGGIKATAKERKQIEQSNKERELRRLEELARNKIVIDGQVTKFRKFKREDVDAYLMEDRNTTFLRYNKASKRVETSKGVQIPERIAKAFYKWLKSVSLSGGCSGNCTQKLKVGDNEWSVEYANADTFKLGCHLIAMSEADAIAKKLKW